MPYNTYGQDEAEDVDTDWQDLLYRTATMTSHDVSISSGTERGNYAFGGGYLLDQAVIPTQQFSRYALRGSVDRYVSVVNAMDINGNETFPILVAIRDVRTLHRFP